MRESESGQRKQILPKRAINTALLIAVGVGLIGWWMSLASSRHYVPRLPEAKEHESHPMPRVDPDRA